MLAPQQRSLDSIPLNIAQYKDMMEKNSYCRILILTKCTVHGINVNVVLPRYMGITVLHGGIQIGAHYTKGNQMINEFKKGQYYSYKPYEHTYIMYILDIRGERIYVEFGDKSKGWHSAEIFNREAIEHLPCYNTPLYNAIRGTDD
jgi:hypothetical protein